MCAINGFNFRNEKLILRMNQVTSHRGPDDTGVFFDEGMSLGHNRLSIIDLSKNASQPMESADGKLTIVFNGEIYNFKELKKELDYPFKTNSDTEVILASYKKWGYDCVKKLNGIFAFAIWNKNKKELFVAKDHVGVKPFYYFNKEGKFIFSSEIKAILEHDIPRVLNREAFNHYLRVLYVPQPLTMFKDIYKLPPASYGVFKNGELKISTYWKASEGSILKKSKSEIENDVREQISQSVKKQLISDKPLGLYLSGGMDSSIILHNVSQVRQNVDTFSIGFSIPYDKEQEEKFNKDFFLARKTAKYYSTNHNEFLFKTEEVPELFEKFIWHVDESIANPTALSMMRLAHVAKTKVDVVLTGEGGDELFGGYDRYRIDRLARFFMPTSRRFERFMFQKDAIINKTVNKDFFDSKISRKFFKEKYFNTKRKLMDVDRESWLVDFALMLNDKMSMSAGLESRVPLLDRDLIELASQIPIKYKTNFKETKIILKDAYRGKIPDFLFNQPKRGWFAPYSKWLRHPDVRKMANELLSADYYQNTASMFNWPVVRQVLEDHCTQKEYNATMLWVILSFQIWAKKFKITL